MVNSMHCDTFIHVVHFISQISLQLISINFSVFLKSRGIDIHGYAWRFSSIDSNDSKLCIVSHHRVP